jgi:hypothetical protein
VNEIDYLGISLNSSVKWDEKEKAGQQKGNGNMIATDGCLSKASCG